MLYTDGVSRTGNIGDRSATNTICENTSPPIPCTSRTAVVSYSPADQVSNFGNAPSPITFPSSVPVRGPNGGQFKSNWPSLLSGGSDVTLVSVGFSNTPSTYFWTGSSATGVVTANTCSSWTLASGTGMMGRQNGPAGTGWLSDGNQNCGTDFGVIKQVLCMCYWAG
jgi:hypothetical protein